MVIHLLNLFIFALVLNHITRTNENIKPLPDELRAFFAEKPLHGVGSFYKSLIFFVMAKTKEGKKKVYVAPHTKKLSNGQTIKVPAHYRSTPN